MVENGALAQAGQSLPTSTSVVVIGGGVAGVSTALYLARWGIPVVLCEKGRIAAEQSSRNWGWIRRQGRDVRELPLMIESFRLWQELNAELDQDIGYRQGGSTYLAETDAELAERAAWLDAAEGFQLDTRLLTAAEVDTMLGQSERRFKGGLHTPSDAYAEPSQAVPALARLAQREGAQLFEQTAVRTLEQQAGRVTGVVTEHGTIACDTVILAGGVWSRPFLENLGLSLPQLAIKSSVQRTTKAPLITTSTVGATGASFRPRLDGGYTIARSGAASFELIPAAFRHFLAFTPILRDRWRILRLRFGRSFFGALGSHRWQPDQFSPFEQVRVFDPSPDDKLLDDVLRAAQTLFPQLRETRPEQRWGGMIDVTPDELPVIDHVGQPAGLILATGLSGHGFGLGPGVGYLAAQLALGREPMVDTTPFRYARFHASKERPASKEHPV